MRSAFLLFAGLLLSVSACYAQQSAPVANQLPAQVAAIMQKHKLPPASLSVFIQDVNAAQPLLLFNENVPRNPASSIKLLTTYAALELLGPAYTWKTEAYLDGTLSRGRLNGNLILKGYGDPFLTTDKFWRFLSELRNKGLQHIAGNLVIDNGYFEAIDVDPGAFDGKPDRSYNAVPSALMVNFQVIGFNFYPEAETGQVRIVTDPPLSNLTLQNNLQLTRNRCNQRNIRFNIAATPPGALVTFDGNYPVSCGAYLMHRLILPPEQQVYGAFGALWQGLGGTLKGQLQSSRVASGQKPFHVFYSQPLAELIRGMNKYSNNVMTRELLLTLAAEKQGVPGSVAKGRAVIGQWLASKGLQFPELVIDNGAGLSRDTRISAQSLGRLLLATYASPYLPELQASLPLAAMDGTLRRRFRGEALAARLRLKTGTINDVKAIAGYVTARSGRRFVISALHNYPGVHKGPGTEVQNVLLRWLFEQ